jgi:hypothetical protein
MRLVDNVMRGDFLKNGFGELGFVYKIDEVIHIQLLEGPDAGQSVHDCIAPVQLTENFLKKNMALTDYHGEVENIFNEYSYEDSDPDGVGIYVRAYNDGTFYAEGTDRTGNYSKDIQFVHELQHIFKMFNVKIDWVL